MRYFVVALFLSLSTHCVAVSVPFFANCSKNNVWHFEGQCPSSPTIGQKFRYPVQDAVNYMGQLALVSECRNVLIAFNSSPANANASTDALHSAEQVLQGRFESVFQNQGGALLTVMFSCAYAFIGLLLMFFTRAIWTWQRWRKSLCSKCDRRDSNTSLLNFAGEGSDATSSSSLVDRHHGTNVLGIRYGEAPILRQLLWLCGLSDNRELDSISIRREEFAMSALFVTAAVFSNVYQLIEDQVKLLVKFSSPKYICLSQMIISAEFVRSECEISCGIIGDSIPSDMAQDADTAALSGCPWSYLPVDQQCATIANSEIKSALPLLGQSATVAQQLLCEEASLSVITWLFLISSFLFLCNGPAALVQLGLMIRNRSLVGLSQTLNASHQQYLTMLGKYGAACSLGLAFLMVFLLSFYVLTPDIKIMLPHMHANERIFFREGAFVFGYICEMWFYTVIILIAFTCINMMLSACILRVSRLRRMAVAALENPDKSSVHAFQKVWLKAFNDVNRYIEYTAPFILYFTVAILCFVLSMMAVLVPLMAENGSGSTSVNLLSSKQAIPVLIVVGLPNSVIFAALLIQGSRLHAAGQSIHELLLAKLDDASSFEHSSSHWSSAVALTSWLSYRIPCMKIAGLRITWQTSARLVYLLGGAIVFVIAQANNGWSQF